MNQSENQTGAETVKVRKNITVPEDLYLDFLSLGNEGESQRDLLGRLIDGYRDNAELRDELLSSRDSRTALEGAIDNYTTMIAKLERDIEDLRSGSGTALTSPAGQSSFGDFGGKMVKDTMDAIKDVCDDETVCVKTTLHLLDKRADGMNQQLDRDHSAEQKRLDREDKVKDRDHKQYLAEKRAQHDKELAMIKKGVVRKEDLEDVVFLGSIQKRKTAGEILAKRKKQAYHAAGADGDEDFDGELVDDGESDYSGMVDEG